MLKSHSEASQFIEVSYVRNSLSNMIVQYETVRTFPLDLGVLSIRRARGLRSIFIFYVANPLPTDVLPFHPLEEKLAVWKNGALNVLISVERWADFMFKNKASISWLTMECDQALVAMEVLDS